MSENSYTKLAAINVNDKLEKKNGLSYLSWAWALDQLYRADPDASWEYHQPTTYGGDTMMVHCTVKAFGKARTAHLPVMDYKNRAIPQPNAFEVNTAMQRCLVKAIALHGLGLYIYAGEDLPESEGNGHDKPNGKGVLGKSPTSEQMDEALASLPTGERESIRRMAADIAALMEEERPEDAWRLIEDTLGEVREQDKKDDTDKELTMRLGLWSLLDSKTRSAIKKVSATKRAN